jgi:hypothetical protein
MIGNIPSIPLLQPQLPPLQPPKIPLSPPHKNSKIRIMKIGLVQLSFLLPPKHDVDDKSLINEPPLNIYNS